jgi:predicted ribosome quality control (RQC) complex YloA/Tae2 family protein
MGAEPPIQAIDLTSLRAVLAELRPALLPSRFEKAQQAEGCCLQLALRSLTGVQWLELSWLAEAPRLLAIPPPPRQGEGSTLAQQLQHGLRNLALVSLEQEGWERVVSLGFAPRPGEAVRRWLVLELMGRHSNLFLLDEERRVVALGRQVRQDRSRLRPISTGDRYGPPPPPRGERPRSEESEADWRRRLSLLPLPLGRALGDAYQGVSPALSRQLTAHLEPPDGHDDLLSAPVASLSDAHWHHLHARWLAWLTCLEHNHFQLVLGGPSDHSCWQAGAAGAASATAEEPARLPINQGLAQYYASRLGDRRRRQRRQGLRQRLEAAAERERRGLELQEQRLAEVPGGEELQRQADALLSLPTPGRDQIDRAQKLYRKARKLRRSAAAITPRLTLHRDRLEALETSLIFLEQAEEESDLAALEEELASLLGSGVAAAPAANRAQRRRAAAEAAAAPLELRTAGGLRLQVGRNHRQNEAISLRLARRGDLWFHAQEQPGSHVVLKASEAAAATADLAAAADVAAHFSRARGNARVPVVMVAVEALQRIPGAVEGTVRHRGGEILWGEPERARHVLATPNVGVEGRP